MRKLLAITGLLVLAALTLLVVDVIGIAQSADRITATRARAISDVQTELQIDEPAVLNRQN